MPKWYKATCVKEIYWAGQTYNAGSPIRVTEEDVQILRDAGVIGDIKKMEISGPVEQAISEAPENASRNYRKRARG